MSKRINLKDRFMRRAAGKIYKSINENIFQDVLGMMIRNNYCLEEKERKELVRGVNLRIKNCELDDYAKDISIGFEGNKIVKINFIYDFCGITKKVEYKFNAAVIKRERESKLPVIMIERDLRKRFTGELVTIIKFQEMNIYQIEVYDNKAESKYKNIKVYFEGDMKSGLPDGKGKLFWADGKLLYEGEFKGGKVSGFGRTYFKSGAISEKGDRTNGILDGQCTCYYENGQIEYIGNKKKGAEDGYGVSYFPNGDLIYKGIWDEGWAEDGLTHRLKNGMLYRYTPTGQFIVDGQGNIIKEITEEEYQKLIS